jgi:Flp pilus assembly protein TadG
MRARDGSALVWTALFLLLLPVMLALSVDGAEAVSAHQALETALTEAWDAAGAPDTEPSPATTAMLTALCRENLPASIRLVGPIRVTSQGLTATATVTLPVPLGAVNPLMAVGILPIQWTTP